MNTNARWAASTATGVAVCLAIGLVLHFGFGIGTIDSASIVQVLLTIVAILIAARAALYALESARAAKETVAPLEQLSSREEGVVRALGALLAQQEGVVRALDALLTQIETEARRQELRDQFDALLRMQRAVQTMALAQAGRTSQGQSTADFAAALADFNAELPRFPRRNQADSLGDAIYQIAGSHLEAMEVADPSSARSAIETEVQRLHAELAALGDRGRDSQLAHS